MIYTLSIDWLSLFCHYEFLSCEWTGAQGDASTIDAKYPWRYRLAEYGTRQYKHLMFVDKPNEQGGWDDFAEVQFAPCSLQVLDAHSVIVRFNNRVLYRPDMWELIDKFLDDNSFVVHNITRIDLCADFNQFAHCTPLSVILRFAARKLRHVGRGVGSLYFNHGVMPVRNEHGHKVGNEYGVNYTGLAFGTHASDARVYLYNKSFELATQGDKPWIRDRWHAAGLNEKEVWRLEVSLKSKACKFKDALTGAKVDLSVANVRDMSVELPKIYHTFARKMFAFVVNRPGITNISREPRIELFNCDPVYIRHVVRNISKASRVEKIIIKALYLLGERYRGAENDEMQGLAQSFAIGIADSTDLSGWLHQKINEWEQPTHN